MPTGLSCSSTHTSWQHVGIWLPTYVGELLAGGQLQDLQPRQLGQCSASPVPHPALAQPQHAQVLQPRQPQDAHVCDGKLGGPLLPQQLRGALEIQLRQVGHVGHDGTHANVGDRGLPLQVEGLKLWQVQGQQGCPLVCDGLRVYQAVCGAARQVQMPQPAGNSALTAPWESSELLVASVTALLRRAI